MVAGVNCCRVACSPRVAVNGKVQGSLWEAVMRAEEDPVVVLLNRDLEAETEATRASDVAGTMRGTVALSAGSELVRDRLAAILTVCMLYIQKRQ